MEILGNNAPIGLDTNAKERSSVRSTNVKNGVDVVDRHKTGSAYTGDLNVDASLLSTSSSDSLDDSVASGDAPATNGPPAAKKQKKKRGPRSGATNAEELVKQSGTSRTMMLDAVSSMVATIGGNEKKKEADKQGFLDFKKDQWEQQSSYNNRRLGQKYEFKWAHFAHEKKKSSIAVLKHDLDTTISKYSETDDDFLKGMYQDQIKELNVMYREQLVAFSKSEVATTSAAAALQNNSTAAPPNNSTVAALQNNSTAAPPNTSTAAAPQNNSTAAPPNNSTDCES